MDQKTAAEQGVVERRNVERRATPAIARLADGSQIDLKVGSLDVVWDGTLRRVAVGITATGALFPDDGSWPGTEPKALLGCQLLSGKSLNINFCNGRIDIASCLTPPA